MKRKVLGLAEKTLAVTLPTEWIKSQNIQKGIELNCVLENHRLVFSPPLVKSESRAIELNADGITERVLRWQVSSFHKQGYDEIVVVNYTDDHFVIIEDLVKNLFVGFIIKEQSNLRIKLGSVALVDAGEFDSTLRRAFRLLDNVFSDLHLAFKNNDPKLLQKQLDHEHTNNQLTNFCECLLNKNLAQKDKGHFWYVIAWNLETVVDNPKYIANYYEDKSLDVTEDSLKLLEDTHKFAVSWYDFFYNFSFESLVNLSVVKKDLVSRCLDLLSSAPKNDIVLINYLHMVILQLADFSASTIALKNDS